MRSPNPEPKSVGPERIIGDVWILAVTWALEMRLEIWAGLKTCTLEIWRLGRGADLALGMRVKAGGA